MPPQPKTLRILAALLLVVITAAVSTTSASAREATDQVPSECLFTDPDGGTSSMLDKAKVLGLSSESVRLDRQYRGPAASPSASIAEQLKVRHENLPLDAVEWGGLAMTPKDADRLEEMSSIYTSNVLDVKRAARKLAGESFVGVTWSYVDGFIVSTTDRMDEIGASIRKQLPGVPITMHRGLVAAVDQLNHDSVVGDDQSLASEVQTRTDVSCGVTMVAFKNEAAARKADLTQERSSGEVVVLSESGRHFKQTQEALGKRPFQSELTGGLKLWSSGRESSSWCTSNVVVEKDPLPEYWLITAAHCLNNNDTVSPGDAFDIRTVTGSHWYQGIGETATNRVSQGPTQYFLYGAQHDIMAIQMPAYDATWNRVFPNKVHRSVGWPGIDLYHNLVWWHWTPDLDSLGLVTCQAGYSVGVETCGVITALDAKGDPIIYHGAITRITNLREVTGMIGCIGDSGGSVWSNQLNGDRNIVGIVQSISVPEDPGQPGAWNHGVPGEGIVQCTIQTRYTSISSILALGFSHPVGMS